MRLEFSNGEAINWSFFNIVQCSKLKFEIVQLTPALTDFKGPTISICYRRISVIANIENNKFNPNKDASNICENERIFLNLLEFT